MIDLTQPFFYEFFLDASRILLVFIIGKTIQYIVVSAVLANIVRSNVGVADDRSRGIKIILRTVGNTIIYGVVLFLALQALGINIQPILAGAGVLGIMAGLGAQTLVKEYISGILITAEDQYRVGDHVRINASVEGTVVGLSMRLTTLKGSNGEVHHVLNSAVAIVTNFSRR